jgi:hypothetical protein
MRAILSGARYTMRNHRDRFDVTIIGRSVGVPVVYTT